jgi:eukaryotic-like serine/threonine-protein kinase
MIAGQQITGTLRLSHPIGQGAMGTVWAADHLALGTQVAVKFMSPALAEEPGCAERFRREAMTTAQVKSPHVVQVFDHGVTCGGAPYIVMELLDGEDLKRRVKRTGPLPPAVVARIIAQIAKALGPAHRLGIVHRDVKPDNLFVLDVEGEPFVKVLDFGIAKHAEEDLAMTATGSVVGTPFYMSPEQLLGAKHVDFRADLWALGVVAYFLLVGRVPFPGETLGSVAVAVQAAVFTLPSAARTGLPPSIDAWMQKALARDPAARFGSAKELAEALELAVDERERALNPFAADLAAAEPCMGATLADTNSGEAGQTSSDAELTAGDAHGLTLTGLTTMDQDGALFRSSALLIVIVAAARLAAGSTAVESTVTVPLRPRREPRPRA